MLTAISDIHKLIRHHRKAAKMTQQALADALGVSWGCVAKWEGGQRTPSLVRLSAIAEALGVEVRLFSRASA